MRRPRTGRRTCPHGKVRYPTFDTACAAAIRVSARIAKPLRCYQCPTCHGWHLTRTPRWKEP